MLDAIDKADLVLLAFPLYVNSLPAPVIHALETIVMQRASQGENKHLPLFAAIANCGFPEPGHNATALAICENFPRLSNFTWAGSLALGAGEGMIHGTPLNEMDGRVIPLKKALDLAAEALARRVIHPGRGAGAPGETVHPRLDVSCNGSLWMEATSQAIQRREIAETTAL